MKNMMYLISGSRGDDYTFIYHNGRCFEINVGRYMLTSGSSAGLLYWECSDKATIKKFNAGLYEDVISGTLVHIDGTNGTYRRVSDE